MSEAIRVVVVDDSPFVCRLLARYLQAAGGIEVVATVVQGARAVPVVKELSPAVVTLDLEMPGLNGLEVLEQLMRDCPTPVVLVSGVSRKAAAATMQALNRGAVDFVLKYSPGQDPDPDAFRQEIISKVRVASRVKVIRSLAGGGSAAPPSVANAPSPAASSHGPLLPGVVVIGASTGGPVAVRDLLANLPREFPGAVLVVQHMPATFTRVLATQLGRQIVLPVKEAQDGERLQSGTVLVAPGDYHLIVRPDGHVELLRGPKISGHCPSIDVTMQSAAQAFGPRAKGIVLTGMGNDGAQGLVSIHARGGRTYAQNAATCVVNGMPQQAIERGVVDHVASPVEIASLLVNGHTWKLEKNRW
jgi:two-component system chemotaxis response regulator CheB